MSRLGTLAFLYTGRMKKIPAGSGDPSRGKHNPIFMIVREFLVMIAKIPGCSTRQAEPAVSAQLLLGFCMRQAEPAVSGQLLLGVSR